LQAAKLFRRALGVGSSSEDEMLVVLDYGQPRGDVAGMIRPDFGCDTRSLKY
jgi:hypothetical protein